MRRKERCRESTVPWNMTGSCGMIARRLRTSRNFKVRMSMPSTTMDPSVSSTSRNSAITSELLPEVISLRNSATRSRVAAGQERTGSGTTDDSDLLAGPNRKRNTTQRRRRVREVAHDDISEFDGSLRGPLGRRVGAFARRNLLYRRAPQ